MPVKLYIWRNHRFLKALDHPGHASVMMTPVAGDTGRPANDVYASWWPERSSLEGGLKGGRESIRPDHTRTLQSDEYDEMSPNARIGLGAGRFQPRAGQEEAQHQTEDLAGRMVSIPVWVQRPDVVIEFPGNMELLTLPSGERIPGVGLNIQRMVWFWKLFSTAPNARYKMISSQMNCTAVALSLLEAGGIHLFAGSKYSRGSYLLPSSIIKYAEEAREKILGINETLQVLESEGFSTNDYAESGFKKAIQSQRSRRTIRRVDQFSAAKKNPILDSVDLPIDVIDRYHAHIMPMEIWSLAEWKKASFVKIGRRKEQVKAIDALLEQYHQLCPFHRQRPRAFLAKLALLLDILGEAHDHMRSKLKSDRHEAVFKIAKQAQEIHQWCRLFEQDMQSALVGNDNPDPDFETLERDLGLYPISMQDDDSDTDSVCSLSGLSIGESNTTPQPPRRSSLSNRHDSLPSAPRPETGVRTATRSSIRSHDLTTSQLSRSGFTLIEGSLPPQEINPTVLSQVHSEAVIAAADRNGSVMLGDADRRSRTYRTDTPSSEESELEISYQEELLGVYRV